MATDTLERVLESQFNNYLREKGLDPDSKLFFIVIHFYIQYESVIPPVQIKGLHIQYTHLEMFYYSFHNNCIVMIRTCTLDLCLIEVATPSAKKVVSLYI